MSIILIKIKEIVKMQNYIFLKINSFSNFFAIGIFDSFRDLSIFFVFDLLSLIRLTLSYFYLSNFFSSEVIKNR